MEMNRAKKPTTTSFRLKYLPTDFYHLSTTPCAFFGGYLSVDTFGGFFSRGTRQILAWGLVVDIIIGACFLPLFFQRPRLSISKAAVLFI